MVLKSFNNKDLKIYKRLISDLMSDAFLTEIEPIIPEDATVSKPRTLKQEGMQLENI